MAFRLQPWKKFFSSNYFRFCLFIENNKFYFLTNFYRVGEYAKNKIESITHSINPKEYVQNHLNVKNQGCLLLFQQLYALISKKILYSMRSPFLTMSQLTIPFFVLNMTMLSLRAIPRLKESPRLHMSLSQFDTPFVKYYYDTNSRQLADKYEKVLEDNIIATNRIQGKNRVKCFLQYNSLFIFHRI